MQQEKTKKIIEKIKSDHIVPEPKWRLNLASYLFWVAVFFMIIFGGISFSLIVFNFLDFGPGFFHFFALGKIVRIFVFTAPYLWIALFVLAIFSGILAFQKTKRGYRYRAVFVGSLSVIFVSLLGVGLHFLKINEQLERGFSGQRNLTFPLERRWSSPKEGMLGGEIREVFPQSFMLLDFRDETWKVFYDRGTEIRLRGGLAPGMQAGIIGEKIGEREFQARFIRPLPGQGQKMPCSENCPRRGMN